MINIKKGLNMPLSGKPQQVIGQAPAVSHVALLGTDYHGLRPSMAVEVGNTVKRRDRYCSRIRKTLEHALPLLHLAK